MKQVWQNTVCVANNLYKGKSRLQTVLRNRSVGMAAGRAVVAVAIQCGEPSRAVGKIGSRSAAEGGGRNQNRDQAGQQARSGGDEPKQAEPQTGEQTSR